METKTIQQLLIGAGVLAVAYYAWKNLSGKKGCGCGCDGNKPEETSNVAGDTRTQEQKNSDACAAKGMGWNGSYCFRLKPSGKLVQANVSTKKTGIDRVISRSSRTVPSIV